MTQPYAQDVAPGAQLPELAVEVGAVQMFLFSAASYNSHRIHYDRRWATEVEGYPDTVVQGHLQAALLARAVTDWMGGDGRLVAFASQNRGAAYCGERLTFRGTVTAVREDAGNAGRYLVDLELRGENAAGDLLMPGTATVQLPGRPTEGEGAA